MPPRNWNPTTVVQGVPWILLGLCLWLEPGTASLPFLMDSVIQALAELEQKVPVTETNHTASVWPLSAQDSDPHDPLHHFLLEGQRFRATKLDLFALSPELRGLIEEVARHDVRGGQEYGVVLAPDGSTVAVEPLLAGLKAGLQKNRVISLPLDSTATPPGARATFPDVGATVPDVWGTLILLQRLEPAHPQLQGMSQEQLAQVATLATKEYTEAFLGCPAIHPRCRWRAAPYRGRPRPLQLPLGFLYVHHTYLPASPCTAFESCAAKMRSMQRYHQDTQGWDDIGYSFVVGSDGYVYEGRGWHWVGAHTLGHNSRGFGVAFVGNYTAELPADAALRTVRDMLPRCAVRAGLLRPDYAVLGHRQVVRTDCPGDALFHLLSTWPHFDANVKPRIARRASRKSKKKLPPVTLPATGL
ncbi:N-acetylmuramoyl-L-alanine amidase isoform 2-T2 [Glossophaga mutica]